MSSGRLADDAPMLARLARLESLSIFSVSLSRTRSFISAAALSVKVIAASWSTLAKPPPRLDISSLRYLETRA